MAKGILNIQAADGAVIGLHVPDGLTSGERPISLGVNLSGITAYHLLQGNLAVSTSTITQGFSTTLYTGNGSTQSITTGIDMSTQWGNTAEEKFGGLVWIKSRSLANRHRIYDTIRGAGYRIISDGTDAEAFSTAEMSSFNANGFSVGNDADTNGASATYASWNFQTTHRVTGTTNHGKAYTCHYNPFTGFTIVKYEGSGLAGHEIPHMLGRKLGFATTKNLTSIGDWNAFYKENSYLFLSGTAAEAASTQVVSDFNAITTVIGTGSNSNAVSNSYIMYGWANSYFDEANKLIGNYEIGVYQGTGVSGNKVTTRGNPAWIMIKRLDSTGNWWVQDNNRTGGRNLYANLSNAEEVATSYEFIRLQDGFSITSTLADANTSGGQYLYMVAYDTNANGGGSYYPLASDTANVQVNNALIPIAQGIDSNGVKNIILSKNETVTNLTYTQGKNYVYYDVLGNKGVTPHKPRYLESELVRTYAGESPDYFNVKENKWYSTNSGSELVTNGTFTSNTTGWTNIVGTAVWQNNSIKVINVGTQVAEVQQVVTGLTIGKKYTLKSSIYDTAYARIRLPDLSFDTGYFGGTSNLANYFTKDIIATSTTLDIRLSVSDSTSGRQAIFDNISLFETTITPTTEITTGRNYLNHIVYADNDGGVLYVEELPKIEYKDIVKANEFKGKNACTAWVNFDGTTTPPTIKDSYNVSSVVRTATGKFDIYFKQIMDNDSYSANVYGTPVNRIAERSEVAVKYINKVTIWHRDEANTFTNNTVNDVQIFGGKNS